MSEESTFESILNREFRWPKLGDKPFTQSDDALANAYVHSHGHGKAIPITHKQLDLFALAEVMEAAGNYFTGCDGYLSHLQSAGP